MPARRPGRRRRRRKVIAPPASPASQVPVPAKPVPAQPVPAQPVPPQAVPAKPVPPQAVPAKPVPVQPAPAKPVPAPPAPAGPAAAAPAAVKRADPLLGQTIGRCRLEARIGQGRTATVYRAHHEALDATVAIKVLLPRAAAQPELVEKFISEARAIARIDNENVLKIYDVGTEGDRHYIVMELLVGEEVQEILERDGRLEVMDALRIVRQSANGLAAAHRREIVHRDVKPQNLVLLEDGTVKVVDFGLAGVEEIGGERVGTPHFMAPETCESGATSARSDVYSLGITLYHLLVGQPPYKGQDVPSILRSHIRGEPLRPERGRPGLPKEVSELVRRMTQKDPAARLSAAELIESLDSFGGETLKEKSGLRRRGARMRSHTEQRKQASLVPVILAVVVVVGGIIALIAASSGGGNGPKPKPPRATTPGPAVPRTPDVTPPPEDPPRGSAPAPVEPPPVDLEAEGRKALFAAETWARRNWRITSDDVLVLAEYEKVRDNHPGTQAALEAAMRIRDIRAGKRHPHPDKTFSDASVIEAAKVAWRRAKPKVEELIARHRYAAAKGLLPTGIDGRGAIGKEVVFWRTFLDHLTEFQTGLADWVPQLSEEKRTIHTKRGTGVVEKITREDLTVTIDGRKETVAWDEVEAATLVSLARAAFQEAPDFYPLYTLAFSFAHRLWEAFNASMLDLTWAEEKGANQDFMVQEYENRVADRRGSTGG